MNNSLNSFFNISTNIQSDFIPTEHSAFDFVQYFRPIILKLVLLICITSEKRTILFINFHFVRKTNIKQNVFFFQTFPYPLNEAILFRSTDTLGKISNFQIIINELNISKPSVSLRRISDDVGLRIVNDFFCSCRAQHAVVSVFRASVSYDFVFLVLF